MLLIADNEMKLKILDIDTGTILFTFLGPLFGQPISSIKVNKIFFYFQKIYNKNVYLILTV